MRNRVSLFLALSLSVLGVPLAAQVVEPPAGSEKFFPAESGGVPDTYIVLLTRNEDGTELESKDSVADIAAELATGYGATVTKIWEHVALGFLATMSAEQAEDMSKSDAVARVQQDVYYSTDDVLSTYADHCYFEYDSDPNTHNDDVNTRALVPFPPGLPWGCQELTCSNPDPQVSTNPSCVDNWGLGSTQDKWVNGTGPEYYAFFEGGTGVRVYMLDSGIRATNREFLNAAGSATRVAAGFNATTVGSSTDGSDCHGHGTHTAGIVGGHTYGIAKNVTLVPVRFTCAPPVGSQLNWLIDGLNWIVADHFGLHDAVPVEHPTEIVNLSGGNNFNWAHDPAALQAVYDMTRHPKIILVQAAGNQRCKGILGVPGECSRTACDYTFGDEATYQDDPALYQALARVIVAGGSDFSFGAWIDKVGDPWVTAQGACTSPGTNCAGTNGGACVDLFAPAAYVVSASYTGDGGYCQLSGTSMAAPHVSGAAALYLQGHPNATADQVKAYLLANALQGKLSTSGPSSIGPASPNLLLQTTPRFCPVR